MHIQAELVSRKRKRGWNRIKEKEVYFKQTLIVCTTTYRPV